MYVDIEEGIIELEVAGKKRILKFGMRCSKLIAAYSQGSKEDQSPADNFDQLALFFFAALKAKESENDLPDGFNLEMALDWMDSLPVKTNEVIMAMGGECLGFIEKYSQILTEKEKRQAILQEAKSPRVSSK